MAKRRDEMMANAKVRDVQREENVKRYRDDDRKEEERMTEAHQGDSADFLK